MIEENTKEQPLKVLKFGGLASKDLNGVKNTATIIKDSYVENRLVVVFSARGRNTRALKKVYQLFIKDDEECQYEMERIIQKDVNLVVDLGLPYAEKTKVLSTLFAIKNEMLDFLRSTPQTMKDDQIYDRIVSIGELLAIVVMSAALFKESVLNVTVDARDFMMTDGVYKKAKILPEESLRKVSESNILFELENGNVVITQGFIGYFNGNITTMGDNSSDETATFLGYALDADEVIIYKDVLGVSPEDPAKNPDTPVYREMSYDWTEELTKAKPGKVEPQILHPDSIAWAKLKNTKVRVRSFKKEFWSFPGTVISSSKIVSRYPKEEVLAYTQKQVA